MVHTKTQIKPDTLDDASWLGRVLRQAGGPVPVSEALVPLPSAKNGAQSTALASPELRRKAEEIVTLARAENVPVFPVAIAPLFAGWRLYTKSPNYDYVFCNLAEDPLFSDPDGFPIPGNVLQHLQRLNRTSLAQHLDLLYVVHEVEKGSIAEGELLTTDKLVPPSPQVKRASRCLGNIGTALWLGASLPLMAGAGLGAAVAGSLASLGLDPLLLGAVGVPGSPLRTGDMAVWFYLSHWRYTADQR